MRNPNKRQIKKLIYLEMMVLSVLLIIAVVVISKLKNPDYNSDTQETDSSATVATGNHAGNTEKTEPTWKTFPEDRTLTANQHFAFDCKAQKFTTISGQEQDRVYPAGLTKLFVAYAIIKTNAVKATSTLIVVGEDMLALVEEGAAVAHMSVGDVVNGRQLMEAMLISGGNDAAYILACQAGRNLTDSPTLNAATAVQVFVDKMNVVLKENGMLNTNLVNPTGSYNPNHYTTVQDLVILSNLCMQYNDILSPSMTPEADIKLHSETVVWKNANALIDPSSAYYCPYAIGLNAYQTPETGSCLLSAFKKDGQYLLIGVFGCPTAGDSFDDALQLFNQIVLQ